LAFVVTAPRQEGFFHETLNLAAVWKAAFVLIIERNGYAYMTPDTRYLPVASLVSRAEGYGVAGVSVDGNDVAETYAIAVAAREHARTAGPVLIEAATYRMHGHGAHDAQRYVPPGEVENWRGRDPLATWQRDAREYAGWSDDDQHELERDVQHMVDVAVEDAVNAPFPDSSELEASVFA
jgi:pyruvate dehydrogenase E1 component alpha subunit